MKKILHRLGRMLVLALVAVAPGSCAEEGYSLLGILGGPIAISEVLFDSSGDQFIELVNNGSEAVDLSGLELCVQINYWTLPSHILAPGARVTVHWNTSGTDSATILYTGVGLPALDTDSDGVGLYANNNDFADPLNILDYVEWGAGGQAREDVAAQAGIWTAGEFINVDNVAEDESLSFFGASNSFNGAAFWCRTDPTPGSANAACKDGGGPMPMGPRDPILVSEVLYNPSAGDQLIEIHNSGSSMVTLDSYWLCVQFDYWKLPAVSIAAGGYLVVHWDADGVDAAGHVYTSVAEGLPSLGASDAISFYSANAFSSDVAIEDFVQWGAASGARSNVAESAGIWTALEFIDVSGLSAGQSIGFDGDDTDDNGPGFWCVTTPTIGAANGTCP